MNCNNLNKWILFAIALVAIGDVLAFFIELVNQQCDSEDKAERQRNDETVAKELKALQKSISGLSAEMKEVQKELITLKKSVETLNT